MQFLFPPLVWGFLLVGVPILIHLINMLRHRKLKWAAMDFLLESHRRNRRWVMLKQWLLLAARMLAMFLLVAMLAKWVSSSQWLGMLGGQATHHYILFDDSYSMAESDQTDSAYSRGLRAMSGLVRSISEKTGQHQLTLLRLSRAALAERGGPEQARIDAAADLISQSVPRDPDKLLDRLSATQPTALQLSPEAALDLITPMIVENKAEKAHVYLLSDLRRNEFGEPEVLHNKLRGLVDAAAMIHLIDCGGEAAGNLSIASVEPEQEVWAAGVPLMIRFQVRNQSNQIARNVVAKVRAISYAEGTTEPHPERSYSGEVMELPPVLIEQIEAGETLTRQVQVIFGLPGKHVVEVQLPDDSLATDNRRWSVIGIREAQRVLLVDGEVDQSNSFYFQTVLSPDARLRTGMTAEQVDAAYLRDVPQETLANFDVIALLDVPRLEPQAVSKLEEFCRTGGGLFAICGRNTNLQFVNEALYRGGAGFFPVQLGEIRELDVASDQSEPQLAAEEHPILAPLRQLSVSPFALLRIRQHIIPTTDSLQVTGIQVVATGPSGVPLVIDKGLGDGRVVAMLTGLTNDWSTWAQDPTFVVMALRTFGYLGSFRRAPTSQPVGTAVEMVVSGIPILPEAEILLQPSSEAAPRMRLLRQVAPDAKVADAKVADAKATQSRNTGEMNAGSSNTFGKSTEVSRLKLDIDLTQTDRDVIDGLLRPGIIEMWMIDSQGRKIFQNFAHNVSASEGSLERVTHGELEKKLSDIPLDIRTAQAVSGTGLSSPEAAHSTLLMGLLAALLLCEQLLAYSASYHAPRLTEGQR